MWLQTKGNSLEKPDFCQGEFSFSVPGFLVFSTCLFPLNATPFFPLCVLSLQGCLLYHVVLISGCFDANGGCGVGGARELDELQMLRRR